MDKHVVSSQTLAKAFVALVFFLSSFSAFAAIGMGGASVGRAVDDDATDQFIVKLRDPSPGQVARRIQEVAVSSAVNLN